MSRPSTRYGRVLIDDLIETARGELVKERTVSLPRLVEGAAEGAVLLQVGPDGVIRRARFVEHDRLQSSAKRLVGMRVQAAAAGPANERVLRFAAVSCGADVGCALVLVPAEEAAIAEP